MILHKTGLRVFAATLSAATFGTLITPGVGLAQTKVHHSFIHRHPHLTEAAGGYAAYKAAKTTGRNRVAAGGHKNFAQRHPLLSGAAGVAVAHHYAHKK